MSDTLHEVIRDELEGGELFALRDGNQVIWNPEIDADIPSVFVVFDYDGEFEDDDVQIDGDERWELVRVNGDLVHQEATDNMVEHVIANPGVYMNMALEGIAPERAAVDVYDRLAGIVLVRFRETD